MWPPTRIVHCTFCNSFATPLWVSRCWSIDDWSWLRIKANLSPCHNCRTLQSTLGPGAAVVQCGEGGAARNYVRVQQRGSNIHLHLTGTSSWPMVWSVSRITLDTISISISDIYCIYIRAIYLWEIFQHKGRVSTWESHWDILIVLLHLFTDTACSL